MWVAVLYDLAVAAHVVVVLAALVAIAVAGGYQAAVVAGARGESVARYFRGGPSWGPRLLAPAAALGLVAAGLSRGKVHLGARWVWVAALLWLASMAAIESLLRPAEKALNDLMAEGGAGGEGGADPGPTAVAARGLSGAVIALAGVVVASVLMTVQ